MIDIDKFKPFNDQFGHPAGDEALREVARVLDFHARPFDVVARYGGEEFVVILLRVDAAGAVSIAERLRRAIEAAPWPDRVITVSIGASTTGREPDSTVLLDFADGALYRMKQCGGNQVAHADDFYWTRRTQSWHGGANPPHRASTLKSRGGGKYGPFKIALAFQGRRCPSN